MPDERYTFETARIRLEEIAVEVRKKDTSLEKSLDLLEEGVRLANICTELVDHTDLSASVTQEVPEPAEAESAEEAAVEKNEAAPRDEAAQESGEPEEGASDAGPDAAADADEDASEEGADAESVDAGGFDETEDDLHEPAGAEAAE